VVANQPMYLAGAMDTPACLKMARFIQICDAFDIPLVVLLRYAGPDGRAGRSKRPA